MKHDVIIVGGGISGMAAAIRLKQLGADPIVIERAEEAKRQTQSPLQIKGDYFQPAAVEILRKINLLDLFGPDKAIRVPKVSFTSRRPLARDATRFEFFYPEQNNVDYGLAVPHETILETLRAEYLRIGGNHRFGVSVLDMESGHRTWQIFLDNGEELRSSAFIGADGRHSMTRKAANIPLNEFPTNRMMMAASLRSPVLSEGDYHIEEFHKGALFALRCADKTIRTYLCFQKTEIPMAYQNRVDYFLEKCRQTTLLKDADIRMETPPLLMPTADTFLPKRNLGTGIWIGDAAGTLDPLSAHGITLALMEAVEAAEIIHATLENPKLLCRNLEIQSQKCHERYLHSRFFGVWAGELFMGGGRIQQFTKWNALNRAAKIKQLKSDLLDFFAVRRNTPLGLYDLPWLLGLIPEAVHSHLQEMKINQATLMLQDMTLTAPFSLKMKLFQKRAADFISGS